MKKILLLISQERDEERTLSHAIALAQNTPQSELHIAYVLDDRFREKYESLLSESTFVADKPGQDVCAALSQEYEARGRRMLQVVSDRCVALKLNCVTDFRSGDYYNVAEELCSQIQPDVLVVSERNQSFWSRAMGMSDQKRLSKLTGVAVVAF